MRKIFYFCLIGLLSSCVSKSENNINQILSTSKFDFNNLKDKLHNVAYKSTDSIQFGTITLLNKEKVKFWFLTHHLTSDIGGTVYEFPDGEREFYSGYHCCEVQFYDSTKLIDLVTFKSFLKETNGINP
jgi:hypothetical protein